MLSWVLMFVFLCWCLGIWDGGDWDDSGCWHLVLPLVSGYFVPCFLLLSRDLRKVVGCCPRDASAGWWLVERRGSCKQAVVGLRVRIRVFMENKKDSVNHQLESLPGSRRSRLENVSKYWGLTGKWIWGRKGGWGSPQKEGKLVPHQGLTESPENEGGVEGETPDAGCYRTVERLGGGAVIEDRKESDSCLLESQPGVPTWGPM